MSRALLGDVWDPCLEGMFGAWIVHMGSWLGLCIWDHGCAYW